MATRGQVLSDEHLQVAKETFVELLHGHPLGRNRAEVKRKLVERNLWDSRITRAVAIVIAAPGDDRGGVYFLKERVYEAQGRALEILAESGEPVSETDLFQQLAEQGFWPNIRGRDKLFAFNNFAECVLEVRIAHATYLYLQGREFTVPQVQKDNVAQLAKLIDRITAAVSPSAITARALWSVLQSYPDIYWGTDELVFQLAAKQSDSQETERGGLSLWFAADIVGEPDLDQTVTTREMYWAIANDDQQDPGVNILKYLFVVGRRGISTEVIVGLFKRMDIEITYGEVREILESIGATRITGFMGLYVHGRFLPTGIPITSVQEYLELEREYFDI